MIIAGVSLADDLSSQVMIFLVPVVNYGILVYWMDDRKNEIQRKAIMEKNRTINLLLAENEREIERKCSYLEIEKLANY